MAEQESTKNCLLKVVLVWSEGPRQNREMTLALQAPNTVADALEKAGLKLEDTQKIGIWGRLVKTSQLLQAEDRIEIYRALKVDPKEARRERFSKQGQGKSGLFAKRRKGSAAGY